jgi:hypothetical protein
MLGVVIASLIAGCGGAVRPTASRPALQAFDTVGLLAGVAEHADKVVYSLLDGRTWERPKDQFRVAYDLSSRSVLFLSATDADGTFVWLIGTPEGVPTDCKHVVRYGAREWGDAIESQGVLWPKAANFASTIPIPAVGETYPSAAFLCLDDHAQATSVMQNVPPADSSPPVGWAGTL